MKFHGHGLLKICVADVTEMDCSTAVWMLAVTTCVVFSLVLEGLEGFVGHSLPYESWQSTCFYLAGSYVRSPLIMCIGVRWHSIDIGPVSQRSEDCNLSPIPFYEARSE